MALVWYRESDNGWKSDPLPATGETLEGATWQDVHLKLKKWFGERGWPTTVDLPLTPTVRSAQGALRSPWSIPGHAVPPVPTPNDPAPDDGDNDDDGDDDGDEPWDIGLFD